MSQSSRLSYVSNRQGDKRKSCSPPQLRKCPHSHLPVRFRTANTRNPRYLNQTWVILTRSHVFLLHLPDATHAELVELRVRAEDGNVEGQRLGCDHAVDGVLKVKAGISADMALRISEAFGTEPDFWFRLQAQRDLWVASRKKRRKVKPLAVSAAA